MMDDGKENATARILIVEDEAILAEDIGQSLENLGYLIEGKVSTGEQAVKLAQELRPDLILMDIKLQGDIDGIEAADRIRASLDIPVVYLTGYSEKDVLDRAKRTEPYGYVGKPCTFQELRSTVETALYKHKADKRVRESEERFRSLIEQAADAIFVHDLDGKFLEVNQQAAISLGHSRDELLSMSVSDIDPDVVSRRDRAKYWSNLPATFEARHRRKDGTTFPVEIRLGPIEYGETKVVLAMVRDITERKKAEIELRHTTSLLNSLVEALPDIVYFKDTERRYLLTNRAQRQFTGLDREATIGRMAEEILPPHLFELSRKSDEQVMRTKEPVFVEERVVNKQGEKMIVETRKFPILDDQGKVIAVGGISRDITERKRLEENLRGSEVRLLDLYENAPNAYFSVGTDGLIRKCNKGAEELLRYPREMLEGKRVFDLYMDGPEGKEKAAKVFKKFISGEQVASEELQMQKADGSPVWIYLSVNALRDADGQVVESRSTVIDISERKKAEEQVRASLREKEILFREIHHRVKNNLAVVQSILRLQSRYAQSAGFTRMLEDAQNRIRSMALAHELLYQSENLAEVNAGYYVDKLLSHLVASLSRVGGGIQTRNEIRNVNLGIDTAIPLGFIITELVSNCFKHAFPDDRRGEISVSLQTIADREFELTVRDNGVGMATNIDANRPDSMGLELVRIFVSQLNGTMKIMRDKGTEVRIKFQEA